MIESCGTFQTGRKMGWFEREGLAQQRMADASRVADALREQRAKEAADVVLALERFYNNLALFSGGTLALSVTFLGYLKSVHVAVAHRGLLLGAWAALLSCVICSLFFAFFNRSYSSYAFTRRHQEAAKKKHEVEAEEIQHVVPTDVPWIGQAQWTRAELDEYIGKQRQAARDLEPMIRSSKFQEKAYRLAWRCSGILGRVGFLVGLVLLLMFAISNT
jgi:hypothetical protein